MFKPYQYVGETPRRFECEGDKERTLMPLKTYLLNDADWHVKAWLRRALLVDGLAENVEPETAQEMGGEPQSQNTETTANNVPEIDSGESGILGGNGTYDLPDYVDESEDDFFYFGWSITSPIRIEKQDRKTAKSSRAMVPNGLLFVSAWQRRKALNYE